MAEQVVEHPLDLVAVEQDTLDEQCVEHVRQRVGDCCLGRALASPYSESMPVKAMSRSAVAADSDAMSSTE